MSIAKADVVIYNDERIPHPTLTISIEQARKLLTSNFPEIAAATVAGAEDRDCAFAKRPAGTSVTEFRKKAKYTCLPFSINSALGRRH
jgi:hypothetical protein